MMRGMISLDMYQEAADFYIELLDNYATQHNDLGVADDVKHLREQYKILWGK